jgi:hypothetical protein
MKSFSKWVIALLAGVSFASTAAAANILATGTVKSVNADKKEFVMTDNAGKDWTYRFGDDVVINRGGKESASNLKADDAVTVCHAKGILTSTAHYILVQDGASKGWRLGCGTFKGYDVDRKAFTYTETDGKDRTYAMRDANVRLNMHDSKMEDIKIGDDTLAVVEQVGDKVSLKALMFSRK